MDARLGNFKHNTCLFFLEFGSHLQHIRLQYEIGKIQKKEKLKNKIK